MDFETNAKDQLSFTAAIEGISVCPGEPCDTSMPRMRVGALETMGREGECSTPNNEFNPPSCITINKFNGKNFLQ